MSDPKTLANRYLKAIRDRDKCDYGSDLWHYYDSVADDTVSVAKEYCCYDTFSQYIIES